MPLLTGFITITQGVRIVHYKSALKERVILLR